MMMNRSKVLRIFYQGIRWSIGLLFVCSGLLKLLDLKAFAQVVDAFGLISWEFSFPAALIISLAEVLAGAGLAFELRGSLSVICLMLTVFMGILGYGIAMGFNIDCGCFGSDDPVGKAFHGLYASLVRDLILLAGVIYLYGWRRFNGFKPVISLNIFSRTGPV